MKQIVICSNQPIPAAGFSIQLANQFVTTICESYALLKEQLTKCMPDLLVADASSGITLDVLNRICEAARNSAVILWVDKASTEFVWQALSAGVRGVLPQNAGTETHLECVSRVAAGEVWIEEAMRYKLLRTRTVGITSREQQIVGLLALGFSNQQLARILGIAEATVKIRVSRLFGKLGVADRLELALFALKNVATDESSASERLAAAYKSTGIPYAMPGTLSLEAPEVWNQN